MSNYRKLFNNSLMFAIGNLGSKIITFIMLPLYTYALSTSDYGIVDLIITTTSLFLPIVGFSIFDSVLRFSMDKNYNPQKVFSNGFFVTIICSIILILTIPFFALYQLRMIVLPILLIVQLFQNLFAQYAKAINEIKIFAVNGILLSFLTAGLNILFLIPFKMGLTGYLISLVLSNLISTFYLFFKLGVFNIFNTQMISKNDIIEQLKYSIPLIPNSIAWWMTNAVGRYFILLWLGTSANGIFAVSSKIPALLTVFTTIFSQSWQLSAIEEYENKASENILEKVYNYYFFLLFVGSSILILFIKQIISLFVSANFFDAWEYVPFLLLSVIFSSLSSFLGSQYIAMKDTVGVFKTTFIGAIVNIILNIMLIPYLGLQGVGISSFISFFIVWFIRHIEINKINKLNINLLQFLVSITLLVCQSLISVVYSGFYQSIIQIIILCILIFLYRDNCISLYLLIRNKFILRRN